MIHRAVLEPASIVLRRGDRGAPEAIAETLEGVRRAEEVTAMTDLDMGVKSETFGGDLDRAKLVVEQVKNFGIGDEFLETRDEATLEPAG